MSYPIPHFTRGQVTRAGEILIGPDTRRPEMAEALAVINHWRACHAYPINTFQATLRSRLQKFSGQSIVATRLKRVTSIAKKLRKNHGMALARMQDVGGLRAVVDSVAQVRRLEGLYKDGSLTHELVKTDDYITTPKTTGYRSLHLIYRYNNPNEDRYNGLCLELQLRTRLQHAWATAVETIGSFLNQALKSSEGPNEWLEYFNVVGNAFALMEKCPVGSQFIEMPPEDIYALCVRGEQALDVRRKLEAFAVATNAITSNKAQGNYHLIFLDAGLRTVSVKSFGQRRLDQANEEYAAAERIALDSPDTKQAVLVTTSSVEALRRAYPNYFLDTRQFLSALARIERLSGE